VESACGGTLFYGNNAERTMSKKRRNLNMIIPTIIMGTLAGALVLVGYYKAQGQHISGIKSAVNMMVSILPLLAFAFIVAGMAQVLLPQDIIAKWVGAESGIRGILIGTIAGALAPGGPCLLYTSPSPRD